MTRVFNYINNGIGYLTGWYRYKKGDDDVALRLSNNNASYPGVIRFNNSLQNPVFQGYNGDKWVDFNAIKGDKGDKGDNFDKLIKLENLGNCNLFPTSEITNNTISIKGIEGSNIIINGENNKNIEVNELHETLHIVGNALPYNWDLSNIDIKKMKSNKDDILFKAYGDVSLYQVANDKIISKGQLVCLTLSNNKICIKPFDGDRNTSEFLRESHIIGIALEDKFEGQCCKVCTNGITTVKVSKHSCDDFINDSVIKFNSIGLVNSNNMISKALVKPKEEFIKVGYFMEDLNIEGVVWDYCLFFIKL